MSEQPSEMLRSFGKTEILSNSKLLKSGQWSVVTLDGNGEPDECSLQVGEHYMKKKPTEDGVDYNKLSKVEDHDFVFVNPKDTQIPPQGPEGEEVFVSRLRCI